MPDAKTLAFYDTAAADYANLSKAGTMSPTLADFMKRLVPGARVLDLGCGPGNSSAAMAKAGHHPDPVDASHGMVTYAQDTFGVPARLGTFDEDWGRETYDGIWASYSLLHAPQDDLPHLVQALGAALRPGGVLYIGMKTGTGMQRDRLDRLYSYVTDAVLKDMVVAAGLTPVRCISGSVLGMDGVKAACVDLTAEKAAHA